MFATYTAKYRKITTGYMGQLVEWPGYKLKAGHFSPFLLYSNSKIKRNLRSC